MESGDGDSPEAVYEYYDDLERSHSAEEEGELTEQEQKQEGSEGKEGPVRVPTVP
jgi:hypothetical protein